MSTVEGQTVTLSIHASPGEAGEAAAEQVADLVRRNSAAVLGLATGSSPLPLYEALAKKDIDLASVAAFALDEYIGLPAGHEQSYAAVIRTHVIEPLGMTPARVHIPDGNPDDEELAGEAYEEAIVGAGGVDLQILGIGSNGHIGFNEPGAPFSSRTRAVTLAERTRRDNARFFDTPDAVPTRAVTQGLATIFEARQLLLIAHGAGKAQAIRRALTGPVTEDFPASLIQHHPNVTVFLDRDAAALL
ncbi:glucosamine-6-phosphate deaminase [Pseudarthrobacter sp. 1C304]|uniref:glucosamine-6-phosphate deaminase n=1 Tax=Pseudarthrobacter sp. 1C304 TaxID=3457438 RepID=UPI003FCFFF78